MNSGVTAERIYDALKRRLLSGDVLPGDKLEPARFADELSSSVTPVRDALHRLTGERLVETWTSDGFHLPLVTEPGLRDLYRWNAWLLKTALASWPRGNAPAASALAIDLGRATTDLFCAIARRAGNLELLEQVGSVNDRLASARVAEAHTLTDLEAELRAIAVSLDRESRTDMLKTLQRYHRRRDREVPAIVRAMYRH